MKISFVTGLLVSSLFCFTWLTMTSVESITPTKTTHIIGSNKENISFKTTAHRKLKKDLVIGDDRNEPIIGSFSGLDVDAEGDIFYADWDSKTVYKFSDDKLIRKIGRSGRGPGEFQYLENMVVRNHKIYVLDGGLLRISVFNTAGKLLKTIPLKAIKNPTKYGSTPSSMEIAFQQGKPIFLLKYKISYSPGSSHIKRTQKYISMNEKGKFIKKPVIEVPQDEKYVKDSGSAISVMSKPFGRRAVVHMGHDNRLYYGWTGNLTIQIYNLNGKLVTTVQHPLKKIRITNKEMKSVKDSYSKAPQKEFHNMNIADTWPAFVDFVVDDHDHIWVETKTENPAIDRWLILDNKGKKLDSFTMTSHVILKKIQNGYAYAYRAPVNGPAAIIRYKIKVNSSGQTK